MSVNLTNFVDIKINLNITNLQSVVQEIHSWVWALSFYQIQTVSKTTVIYQASTDRTSVVGDLKIS